MESFLEIGIFFGIYNLFFYILSKAHIQEPFSYIYENIFYDIYKLETIGVNYAQIVLVVFIYYSLFNILCIILLKSTLVEKIFFYKGSMTRLQKIIREFVKFVFFLLPILISHVLIIFNYENILRENVIVFGPIIILYSITFTLVNWLFTLTTTKYHSLIDIISIKIYNTLFIKKMSKLKK